jgi:hypothetical protein
MAVTRVDMPMRHNQFMHTGAHARINVRLYTASPYLSNLLATAWVTTGRWSCMPSEYYTNRMEQTQLYEFSSI